MKTKTSLLLLVLLLFEACQTLKTAHQETPTDAFLYQKSIENAIYPEAAKVDTSLVFVGKQNKNLVWKNINGEDYLLVVTWKQNVTYYKQYLDSAFYNTGSYPIWITTAPELQQRMKLEKPKDVNRRLIQLLGLPPNSVYSYFVEFWVKPADLFRPCPDQEITDKKCDICFPEKADPTHIAWINSNRISRYYQCDLYSQYPWTQLGYTYDWNPDNKSHVGLSEFVIGANKKIVVKGIYTTAEYLRMVGTTK
jgi:hypothetical protein